MFSVCYRSQPHKTPTVGQEKAIAVSKQKGAAPKQFSLRSGQEEREKKKVELKKSKRVSSGNLSGRDFLVQTFNV